MTPKEAIAKTQSELKANESKWVDRFTEYISKSVKNVDSIVAKRKKFHKWGNLSVYFTIGRAKDDSSSFDLRYQGQSVGEIRVHKNGEIILAISETQFKNNTNEKYLVGYPKDICAAGTYKWDSKEAAAFRKYFKNNPGKSGHPEHKYENLLLKELSSDSSAEKSLTGIQPVTIGTKTDLFFQMPTPLTASGSDIVYSDGHGGIDILARRNGRLTVLELKDEFNENEGPDKVITQAIAYATFIVELCNTKARDDFWKLCGFNNIPTGKETINVSILMPEGKEVVNPEFAGEVLSVPGSDMKLELNYIFFDKEKVKITRASF